jgi:hypothetical protein
MTLWIIRFAQETDARNRYGGEMCKRTAKPSTETWPCTFAIVQFGRVHEITFSLTFRSRRLILAASPESCAILRRRFGTLIQIKVRSRTQGP